MGQTSILATTALALLATAATAQTATTIDPAPAASTPAAAPEAATAAEPAVATLLTDPNATAAVTVTRFFADDLAVRGVRDTSRLLDYIPNAASANVPGSGAANFNIIRGLGTTETLGAVDPAVGTSIDGVYLTRQLANNFAFFDLDRIDVLRGPQGTAFGKNVSGGLIDVRLKTPGDRLAGYFEGGYGAYQAREFRGSLDIPFTPGIAVKLTGYYRDNHGVAINSTTGERNNGLEQAGVRGAVRLTLTDRLSWNGAVAYMRNDGENLPTFDCDPRNPANCSGRFLTSGLRTAYDAARPSPFAALGVTGRKANFGLASFTDTVVATSDLKWESEAFTVDVITGNATTKAKSGVDYADGRTFANAAVPIPAVTGYASGGYSELSDTRDHQFSNEVRVGGALFADRLQYVAGAYYLDEGDTTDFATVLTTPVVATVPAGPRILADRTLRTTTRSTAGYLQVDARLTERLTLTGGVRYTDEYKTFRIADNRPACQITPVPAMCLSDANLRPPVAGGTVAIPTAQSTRIWTPRASIDYQLDHVLVFASATRGFTGGGWNARALTPGGLLPFDAQRVWTYEGGIKTDFFDHRLRIAATGFYLDARGLQTTSANFDPVTGLAFTSANTGYRNRGVEVEATVAPFRGLNLYANLGYQNDGYRVSDTLAPSAYGAKAVRQQQADCRAQRAAGRVPLSSGNANAPDCGTGIVDTNGDIATPAFTPSFTAAVGGSYDYPIPAAGIILEPSANAVYRSSSETGTANASVFSGSNFIGGSRSKSRTLVNAALAMKTDDNNWVLSAECNNCLDRSVVDASIGTTSTLNPPRTWLVRAKRAF